MDSSTAAQNRKSKRASVFLSATLEVRGQSMPVKLRNLSADGALVEAQTLPIEGTEVHFRRNELEVYGRVVWVNNRHAGIAFDQKLAPEQVLRHVPSPAPRMRPEFRRPGLHRDLSPEERRLAQSWIWAPAPTPEG